MLEMMNHKKLTLVCMMLLTGMLLAHAHEFWLQADKFFVKVGERLNVKFMVGENFMGESWDLSKHRIEKFELYGSGGVKNISDSVRANKGLLQLTMNEAGTKLLVMQSNNAFLELPASKFNEYLKDDGLDVVYAQREKTKSLESPSRELYARYTKLYVQVGGQLDDVYKKMVGLPVEIIPDKNPYALKKGDPVRFLILFEGKPLFGAKVRIWNRFDNRTTIQNIYTEKDGMVSIHISNPGSWMVSFVKMVPSKDPKADWQSYWGSLVFGIK
jgi:uncharacterized GH25 family protein